MPGYSYSEVFVPGGFPDHTYNPRTKLNLENRLGEVLENLCKLTIVTGHTKSGKTVLVRRVLPRENAIWIDGGSVGEPDDFWTAIVNQLNLFQVASEGDSSETAGSVEARARAGTNLIIAKSEGEVAGTLSHGRAKTSGTERSVSSRTVALLGLAQANTPLVIDDFHYLPKAMQGDVVRALKQPIFDGLPVVIIAIPHRRYDAVKVEKEMTGRILPINIPLWAEDELQFIPKTGFELLKGPCSNGFAALLAEQSIGSPHLMQEFCRAVCRHKGAKRGFEGEPADLDVAGTDAVFKETAETIGRPIFEKLARGPRQRTDRKERELGSGETVDIYGLILHALAHLKPGLVTVEYEQLRAAIRDISASDSPSTSRSGPRTEAHGDYRCHRPELNSRDRLRRG